MQVKRILTILSICLFVITIFSAIVFAAGPDSIISRWEKKESYSEAGDSAILKINATYYAAEYVEAVVQREAEKNLWTQDEMENYKYDFLKSLQMDEYIPIHIAFDSFGPSLHMAPFDRQVSLWIGKKKYSPSDYDKRFNFKLMGKRDGLVYFPRYDEKTGKPLLENVDSVRLVFKDGISTATMGKTVEFIWDVYRDDPTKLFEGKAASQIEIDRLIKRIEKLNGQKTQLEAQLAEIQAELDKINQRIDELRKP